ncbi:MAG: 3-oxoacyl-ACP reductase FabG [bacterium]|nr:3-oxoacyl-ACP reductase FabG [bacterium]
MELHLQDKVALVTGASHGLGKSICFGLAAEGAKVVVNYRRSSERAEAVVKEIQETYGVGAMAVYADMGQEDEIVKMFEQVEERFSQIDILVNNAAVCPQSWVKDTPTDNWDFVLQVNLTGPFIACREMVKRVIDAERPGRIVNVSSVAAFHGSTSGQAAYDASKGGMNSFTVSLAREVAPHGITVNALAPGLMVTEMTEKKYMAAKEKYLSRIPLGRFGETDEIADAVVFLCSDRARYITGTTMNVSGGILMR